MTESERGRVSTPWYAGTVRRYFVAGGALSGFVALVWVAYLAGVVRGGQLAKRSGVQKIATDATPSSAVSGAAGGQSLTTPPEVWTRMAGLNVWIAGHREPEGKRQPRIVVMLHGFAKPRETLLIMAEREASKFGTIFIFPEAPVALDWRRRAWWRPRGFGVGETGFAMLMRNVRPGRRTITVTPDEEVVAARRQVISLLTEVRRQFDVQNDELLLAGFSQGATLALDVAVHLKEPVGGLAFLSGKSLEPTILAGSVGRLRGVPVLISHGRYDPIASFNAVDKMRRTMKQAGIDIVWVPFDGGHDIPPLTQVQLRRFIRGATERKPASSGAKPVAASSPQRAGEKK